MILRNNCWQEDRLLLRKFLDGVETLRGQKKRNCTKKADEGTPVNMPQWSGEWRAARDQLVTDELRWIERARTGGLPTESETGRWQRIPKELRKCECGAKQGTPMHAVGKCPLFDNERRKTKIRLRELGLLDENIWSFIVKAGGAMKTWPDSVEKKRVVLAEANAFIARIMEKRKRP